jgi:hypothetical protein
VNDGVFYRLDQTVRAKVFNHKNKTFVSIRKYDDHDGELVPRCAKAIPDQFSPVGGNGLALTKPQWDVFFKQCQDIDADVERGDSLAFSHP